VIDVEEEIGRRLEELSVRTSAEELRELASAYPALVAWMRMAEELARNEDEDLPE
jgi:predicted phage tail protein